MQPDLLYIGEEASAIQLRFRTGIPENIPCISMDSISLHLHSVRCLFWADLLIKSNALILLGFSSCNLVTAYVVKFVWKPYLHYGDLSRSTLCVSDGLWSADLLLTIHINKPNRMRHRMSSLWLPKQRVKCQIAQPEYLVTSLIWWQSSTYRGYQ